MKIRNIFSISLVLILCILCSCNSKDNKLLDLDSKVREPEKLSFKTEYSEYNNDVEVISYSITNISTEETAISFTEFELQYKANNEWKIVAFKDTICFEDLSQIIKSGESINKELKLDTYYNLPLKSGEYRIVKDGYTSNVFKIN